MSGSQVTTELIDPNETTGGDYASAAHKLLANGGDIDSLRLNSVLRDEEWEQIDQDVIPVAQERLNFVSDVVQNNMTFNLTNPLGTQVVEHEKVNEMTPAEVSMDAVTRNQADRLTFTQVQTPVPIIHHQFHITVRNLEASRKRGERLDTTAARAAMRQVSETTEDLHINGPDKVLRFNYDNKTAQLNGVLDFPDRNTVSKTGNWADSSVSGKDILDDVRSMLDAAQADNHFGNFNLYVPQNWWIPLLEDFKAESDKTILQRIQELPQIDTVKPLDKLPNSTGFLFEKNSESFDILRGFDPRTVQWESGDGMVFYFRIMSIMVPRPKSDINGNSGIVEIS